MNDSGEREGGAVSVQAPGDAEFLEWAARQPIRFEVVDGRRVRLSEERQGEGRLMLARGIAVRAFGSVDTANAWLATPAPDLGDLSPADLIAEGDEGSRLALLALVRQHRGMLAVGDG